MEKFNPRSNKDASVRPEQARIPRVDLCMPAGNVRAAMK